LHSALLVPYHSWRISHRNHHGNTGSIDNDEVFVPTKLSELTKDMLKESPLYNAFLIVLMVSVGWMPGYLFINATGPRKYRDKAKSHFNPYSALFEEEDFWYVVLSDLGMLAALSCIFGGIYLFGLKAFFCFYLIPYMIVNYHLVLITYLQHTDVFMPHFDKTEWTWLRGALCTVDRSFGPFLDYFLHHITDTHLAHHLFSNMPFYHASEATEHVKRVLGPYYLRDETPIA
jgi:omega-6 fatty acid desaturase (delta-12 desaturase)